MYDQTQNLNEDNLPGEANTYPQFEKGVFENDLPPSPATAKKHSFLLLLASALLFVFSICATFAYAIAYEKIDIGNEDLQRKIAHAVMSIPFAPKTPRYVLEKALIAHTKITSHSFDASASVATSNYVPVLGLNTLDVKFAGSVDYADLANIYLESTIDITNKFQATIRKIDNMVYAKVEKLPIELFVLLGVDSEKLEPLVANWISYDVTPLESEASNLIKEDIHNESYTKEIATRIIETLIDREILNSVQMTTETFEEDSVYVLDYKPTSAEIDSFFDDLQKAVKNPDIIEVRRPADDIKLSDIVTSLEIKVRISDKDDLLRWLSIKAKVKLPDSKDNFSAAITPYLKEDGWIDFAFVLKLNDFNQQFDIKIPANALTFEEYAQKVTEAVNPKSNLASSRDVTREADLHIIIAAVYAYAAEHNGNLPDTDNSDTSSNFPTSPTCIGSSPGCFDLASAGSQDGSDLDSEPDDQIVPNYIDEIPKDPSTGTDADTGYTIHLDSTGRIVAEAKGEARPSIRLQK